MIGICFSMIDLGPIFLIPCRGKIGIGQDSVPERLGIWQFRSKNI